MLAKAYAAQGNIFWVIRVLHDYLAAAPGDCEAKSWLAWLYLGQGDLEGAGELLRTGCADPEERMNTRFALLRDFLRIQNPPEKGEIRTPEGSREKIKAVFPEDLELYRFNRAYFQPDYLAPFSGRLAVGGGYATNAPMGSPGDPELSEAATDSPLTTLDFWANILFPGLGWVRPKIEFLERGVYFWSKGSDPDNYPRQYSYLDSGIKPGIILSRQAYPRFSASYHGDFLLSNRPTESGEKTPLFLYEGHRGELEFSPAAGFTIFAGAGRRIFNEISRSRWEMDGGLGAGKMFSRSIFLLGAAAFRSYQARGQEYDDIGVTGLLSAAFTLNRGLQIRADVSLGWDDYYNSRGYYSGSDRERRDTSFIPKASALVPVGKGWQGGLEYGFSDRRSTIPVYEYRDHRIILKITWDFSLDPWEPRPASEELHIPLDYGLGTEGQMGISRQIQELLQQNESVRRGSSCQD